MEQELPDGVEEMIDDGIEDAIKSSEQMGFDFVHVYLCPPNEYPGEVEIKAHPSDERTPEEVGGCVYAATHEVGER